MKRTKSADTDPSRQCFRQSFLWLSRCDLGKHKNYSVVLRYLSAFILCLLLWPLLPTTAHAHALHSPQSNDAGLLTIPRIEQKSVELRLDDCLLVSLNVHSGTTTSVDWDDYEIKEHCVTCTVSALPAIASTLAILNAPRDWRLESTEWPPDVLLLPPDRPPQS